ncbi:MAG: hypothetical protein FJW40_17865 [Acidobacteria bacterium]|nr:hypothetical protein [Acidobacteriota bacterium]
MSIQVFLEGKILGIDAFLAAGGPRGDGHADARFLGRAAWVSLLSEVLPRALLAELGLAQILLGASGGGQFLVVLPQESRDAAGGFLDRAAAAVAGLSGGTLRLVWASTENLGDWSIVRRRMSDEMLAKRAAPLASGADVGVAFDEGGPGPGAAYFEELWSGLREAVSVGWSPDEPAKPVWNGGTHQWPASGPESITLARHQALIEDGSRASTPQELARRSEGRRVWGVLRGDVDNFGTRIRRAQSIEEYVQLSVLFRQFFAGEVEVLCSMPEFWRKVSVIHTAGDDFAVFGAWDALIAFARELQRLFQRFCETNLKDFSGIEGKTLSAALALAGHGDTLAEVFEAAGAALDQSKSGYRDSFHLLGRGVEWKQLADAVDLKEIMTRLVREFGCSTQFLDDLGAFYREGAAGVRAGRKAARFDKPWRFYRRLNRSLEQDPRRRRSEREFEKARTALMTELIGRNQGQVRLRPTGRVALEWARLLTEA